MTGALRAPDRADLPRGLGSVTNAVYPKRLSEAGLHPQSVLAARFFLILAVTRTLTGLSAKPHLAATFLPTLFTAVIGVAIPLYLLQVEIKHTEPITAAIVPSLPPLAAYLPQLPVGRLKAPALTLAGVLAIVILVARLDARNGSSSASQPAAAVADPSQATRTR